MKQRLHGPNLFLELRKIAKNAHREAVKSFIEKTRAGLQAEFDLILLDIQNVVCEEGEVSESRRYHETASQAKLQVEALAQALDSHHRTILQLRERAGS
jgi:hypothetical protein